MIINVNSAFVIGVCLHLFAHLSACVWMRLVCLAGVWLGPRGPGSSALQGDHRYNPTICCECRAGHL